MKYTRGDYYECALIEQQKNNWRTALNLIHTGSNEGCGMCWWLIGYTLKNGYWGTKNSNRATKRFVKGMMVNNPRCTAEIMKEEKIKNGFLVSGKVTDSMIALVMCGDDNYAKGIFYQYVVSDRRRAHQFYLEAANEGNCFAELEVAYFCENENEKIQWLRSAAQKGLAVAQHDLLHRLKNENERVYWGRKAADQTYAEAQYMLALWFLNEDNKFQNPAAALYWLNRTCADNKHKQYAVEQLSTYKELFARIENCRISCMTVIAIRSFTASGLSTIPKDVVVLFVKYLWKTRNEYVWEKEKDIKRVKTSIFSF